MTQEPWLVTQPIPMPLLPDAVRLTSNQVWLLQRKFVDQERWNSTTVFHFFVPLPVLYLLELSPPFRYLVDPLSSFRNPHGC